jgi:hypothetical protein
MDPFTHLMEGEGLTFPQAVERLAAQAGFIPQSATIMPFPTPQRDKRRRDKGRLAIVTKPAMSQNQANGHEPPQRRFPQS